MLVEYVVIEVAAPPGIELTPDNYNGISEPLFNHRDRTCCY